MPGKGPFGGLSEMRSDRPSYISLAGRSVSGGLGSDLGGSIARDPGMTAWHTKTMGMTRPVRRPPTSRSCRQRRAPPATGGNPGGVDEQTGVSPAHRGLPRLAIRSSSAAYDAWPVFCHLPTWRRNDCTYLWRRAIQPCAGSEEIADGEPTLVLVMAAVLCTGVARAQRFCPKSNPNMSSTPLKSATPRRCFNYLPGNEDLDARLSTGDTPLSDIASALGQAAVVQLLLSVAQT